MPYTARDEGRYSNRRDRERKPEVRSLNRLREMREMRTGRMNRPTGYFGRTGDRPMRGNYSGGYVNGSRIDRLKRLEQRLSRPKRETLKSTEELDKEIDKYFGKSENKESSTEKKEGSTTKPAV